MTGGVLAVPRLDGGRTGSEAGAAQRRAGAAVTPRTDRSALSK